MPAFGPFHHCTVVRKAEVWRVVRAEQVVPRLAGAFRLAMEVRVPIALGSDCGARSRYPNGEDALEMELMVQNGMSPDHAVQAGTSEAARTIGMSESVSSLEPGKLADLIVVDGNPLESIGVLRREVKLVMKGGRIYRDDPEG